MLYGSMATGEESDDSDIDIVVITDSKFECRDAIIIKELLENCTSLPIHALFFPKGMENHLIEQGGIFLS